MLRIETEEGDYAAREVVRDLCSLLQEKPLSAAFKGLGNFGGGRVLFIEILESEPMSAFYQVAVEKLEEKGVEVLEKDRGFNPHLTVAKVRGGGGGGILVDSIPRFKDTFFGDQQFLAVDLCSHFLPKKYEDGYYWTLSEK